MGENLGMLKKWLIVLSIPLLFQLVFLGVLLKSQANFAHARKQTNHSKEVIAQADAILRLLVEARDDVLMRHMAGTGARDEFAELAARILPGIASLSESVRDNPPQVERAGRIGAATGEYLERLRATDRAVREGRNDDVLSQYRDPDRPRMVARIRGLIAEFLKVEETIDAARQAELQRAVTWQTAAIYLGGALSVGLSTILVVAFSREFTRRIGALAENARRLAEGKALAAPIRGKDEIGQLAAIFDDMARALAEREQENEMFIFSVSHDLRSPLVNLQGFSKELAYSARDVREAIAPLEKPPAVAERLAVLLDRDVPDAILYIQTAVSRLSAIIDSLLRLSRAGRVEYRMQALDVGAIVARVIEALRSSIAETGAEIAVAGDLPPAWGDPTAVEQVFANLLSNAVKYLDPGRPGRIEIGAGPPGGDGEASVTYHVRDNGLGIAPAHQPKLFLAFQRLHPGVASGEGIGLALVRRVVERHGGKVWVESEAGAGSTFFLTLPAAPAATATHETAGSAHSATGDRM